MNSLWMAEASTSHIENKKEHATFCKFIAPTLPKKESEPEIQAFSQYVDKIIRNIDKQENTTSVVTNKRILEQEFDKAQFLARYEED